MTTDEHMESLEGVFGNVEAFVSGEFDDGQRQKYISDKVKTEKAKTTGFSCRVSMLKRGDEWLLRFRKKPWLVEVRNDLSGPYPTGPGFLLTYFFEDDERGHAALSGMESVLDYIQGIIESDAK